VGVYFAVGSQSFCPQGKQTRSREISIGFGIPSSPSILKTPPTIPGVRGVTSEYGIGFLIMLAHHVYWTGLSMRVRLPLLRYIPGKIFLFSNYSAKFLNSNWVILQNT